MVINDDASSFHSVFDANNTRYIMLTVNLIISIFIFFGKVMEATGETLKDERVRPEYIKNQIIKAIVWTILRPAQKTLYL